MLFETASSLIKSVKFTALEKELLLLKKAILESDEISKVDALYSPDKVDSGNKEAEEPTEVSGSKKLTITRPQRPQSTSSNLNLSPTTVKMPASVGQTLAGALVTKAPASNVVNLALPQDIGNASIVVTKQNNALPIGVHGQEIQLLDDETDPMESLPPMDSNQSMHEDYCSTMTETPAASTIKIQDLAKIPHNNEYMEIEIPDGADELAQEYGNVIANSMPEMPKGTIIVQQPVQTLIKEKPVAKIQVQRIQVLPPEQDPNGVSVAGMADDLMWKCL